MTNERPILFQTEMVQAILAGQKSQTRRTVKMPKEIEDARWGYTAFTPPQHISVRGKHANGQYGESFVKCPYGMPGDLLWVRETWQNQQCLYCSEPVFVYKADEHDAFAANDLGRWKPSIHMPKAAARIWLKITDIRVERLHAIGHQNAIREGVYEYTLEDNPTDYPHIYKWKDYTDPQNAFYMPHSSFKSLWVSINGPQSWRANPWVWVVSFEVVSTTGRPVVGEIFACWGDNRTRLSEFNTTAHTHDIFLKNLQNP